MADVKLKVCGMRDASNILKVAELNPDYMGFIFYRASPRYVGDDFAIPEGLSTTIKRVGVFVDETTTAVMECVHKHRLDVVQLHGHESPEQCRELKNNLLTVIKVLSVDDETSFAETDAFADAVDFFLFDTKGRYYGGNARTFNWQVLSRYKGNISFFLSGGLSPDNTALVGEMKRPDLYAIDVNSGVEMSPAVKDTDKVRSVVQILRNLNQ